MRISVLGAGSWGSAIAIAFSQIAQVFMWSNNAVQVKNLTETRINPEYLPKEISFPANIDFTLDFNDAITTDLIIIATPVSAFREILMRIKGVSNNPEIPDIIWLCKGLEPETGLLPHQIIQDVLGENVTNFGALLGPSFAKEVALFKPTAITLASFNHDFTQKWINLFQHVPNFRVYANEDLIGAEIATAVKNVIAIAAGITDGLNFGYNARAALITRSLYEIAALIKAIGGKVETLYGLTGVGDLILTCTGDLSRNRTVGMKLALGMNIAAITKSLGHVAEGVFATKEIHMRAQKVGVEMPIVNAVYQIIYKNADINQTIEILLKRQPKSE